jgi:transposase
LRYDGRHPVGLDLARTLIDAAKRSVVSITAPLTAFRSAMPAKTSTLRRRLHELDHDIEGKLREHEVGRLLTTIEGIGPHTAARVIAELGDPALFRSASALAAYVGAIPALKQSGKRTPTRAGMATIGNARLRAALWMPTRAAVRFNPWLRAYYQRLRARGKLPKVALLACLHELLFAIYAVAKHRRPFVAHNAAP